MLARPSTDDLRAHGPGSPAARYLHALLAGQLGDAEALVRSEAVHGMHHVYVEILQPALYEVGRLWEQSRLSVAQEHFCTAATQQIMASCYPDLEQMPRRGRRLLATSVGGNYHAIGIRMLSDIFELGGWVTQFLGADRSIASVRDALAASRFDVLAISAALVEHIPTVASLIAALRTAPARDVPWILVGGLAFNADPTSWREVGADGHATTPDAAVALANRLVDGGPAARAVRDTLRSRANPTGPRPARPPRRGTAPGDDASLAGMSLLNNQLHDLTRMLAEKNAELVRVNERLNRMMGMAAHDLRTPLTVIKLHSEFLLEDLADPTAEQRDLVAEIERSSTFMARMIDDLLDVSQIRAGALKLDREPVELAGFVADLIKLSEPIARRKGIALHYAAPAEPIVVDADPARIQQAVNNLVGNAIKYSRAATRIEISLTATDTDVRLAVRDQGQGIAADELGLIFRPFETTTTRATAGEKSTGLGLAIVRAIVEAHGGRVSVASELGVGTRFDVVLPRSAP